MESTTSVTWSNLPKEIIIEITSYTYTPFKPSLRLINKHWCDCINPLIFDSTYYTIRTLDNNFIQDIFKKFGRFINSLKNYSLRDEHIEDAIKENANIKKLRWNMSNEPWDLLIEVLTTCKKIKYLSLSDGDLSNWNGRADWNQVVQSVQRLTELEELRVFLHHSNLTSLLNVIPKLQLRLLDLVINSDNFFSTFQYYKTMKNLKKLNLVVCYTNDDNVIHNRSDIPTPNKLLIHPNLDHIYLCILYYDDDRGPIGNYLGSELKKMFSNPRFNQLKSLEWYFNCSENHSDHLIFDEPIESHRHKWINLTKLTLFSIDSYLMAYVIEHCPNLVEMSFSSPLVLPHHPDPMSLPPVRILKKLCFGGVSIQVYENHCVIQHLFPNIVTLHLDYIEFPSDQISLDAYYIPLLFPQVTKMIFEIPEYKFDRLISEYNGPILWEELYISLDKMNQHPYNAILAKAPHLKVLYIDMNNFAEDFKFDFDRKDIMVYLASQLPLMSSDHLQLKRLN